MFRKTLVVFAAAALVWMACAEAPSAGPDSDGSPEVREYVHPVEITPEDISRARSSLPEGARARTCIVPPWPNRNHWPPTNDVPGFIVIPVDGVTGQHIYYIHESVVPEEGLEFDMVERLYTLEDGTQVGGLEFSPHGTFFLDHTYLYWDFSYLCDEPPEEMDLLYWASDGEEDWLVDLHRDLTPREKRRVQFEIDHFSIYAVRKSSMPKPPPPSGSSFAMN